MSTEFGFSDLECKIIKAQIERRAKYRKEFLRLKSDPCKHSMQAGYVFDEGIQRFLSMKVTMLDHFRPNPSTISFAVFAFLMPLSIYGYAIWTKRQKWLREIACGRIKYKDRMFVFQ